MIRSSAGMRFLPNVIAVFFLIFGVAWALAGLGYIRDTPMSGSYIGTGLGLLAAVAGVVILVSVNGSRLRLWRSKANRRSRTQPDA